MRVAVGFALAMIGGFCFGYVVRLVQNQRGRMAREVDKTLVACERDGIAVLVTYRMNRWRLVPRHIPMLPDLAFKMFGDPREVQPERPDPERLKSLNAELEKLRDKEATMPSREDYERAMREAELNAQVHSATYSPEAFATIAAYVAQLERPLPDEVAEAVDVVFDGPPNHEGGRFVEVENLDGASVSIGEWIDRGNGYWALRLLTVSQKEAQECHSLDKSFDYPMDALERLSITG